MGFVDKLKGFFGFEKAKRYRDRDLRALEDKERFDDSNPQMSGDKGKSGNVNDYLRLYRSQPWVYACVRDISQAVSTVDFQVLRDETELNKKHPIYRLIRKPNKNETFGVFRRRIFIHLELTGNSFIEIVRDKQDNIIGMYVLRPDWIKILPHPKHKIAGYLYEIPGGETIAFSPEEILHLMYSDSEDEFWGISPAMAAQNGILLDFYAATFNRNYFIQGAEPNAVFESEFSITEKTYDRIRNTWHKRHGGSNIGHLPAILEEGLKYKPITSNHKDMQFIEQRKSSKEEIFEVFDVPIDWRKDLKQKKSFYFSNIIPKLTWFAEVFNEYLLNPEGAEDRDKFQIKFITRSIEAMVEDEEVKAKIAQSNVSHGIWTPNEAREYQYGWKPVPWGDTYWAPVGLMEWDNPRRSGEPEGDDGTEGPLPTDETPSPNGNGPGRNATTDDKTNGTASPSHVPKINQKVPVNDKTDPIKKKVDEDMINITVNMPEQHHTTNINVPEIKIPEIKMPDSVSIPAPQVNINIEKQDLPQIVIPAPVVNLNVEKQDLPQIIVPAPVVNLNVEKQDREVPIINFNPQINIEQPEININPELKVPNTIEEQRVLRDKQNRITGTITEKKVVEEDKNKKEDKNKEEDNKEKN
jgi:HK97 family phage portal protein